MKRLVLRALGLAALFAALALAQSSCGKSYSPTAPGMNTPLPGMTPTPHY